MKKLILSLLFAIPTISYADTVTTGNPKLILVSTGAIDRTRSWGDKVNENFSMISSSMSTLISTVNNLSSNYMDLGGSTQTKYGGATFGGNVTATKYYGDGSNLIGVSGGATLPLPEGATNYANFIDVSNSTAGLNTSTQNLHTRLDSVAVSTGVLSNSTSTLVGRFTNVATDTTTIKGLLTAISPSSGIVFASSATFYGTITSTSGFIGGGSTFTTVNSGRFIGDGSLLTGLALGAGTPLGIFKDEVQISSPINQINFKGSAVSVSEVSAGTATVTINFGSFDSGSTQTVSACWTYLSSVTISSSITAGTLNSDYSYFPVGFYAGSATIYGTITSTSGFIGDGSKLTGITGGSFNQSESFNFTAPQVFGSSFTVNNTSTFTALLTSSGVYNNSQYNQVIITTSVVNDLYGTDCSLSNKFRVHITSTTINTITIPPPPSAQANFTLSNPVNMKDGQQVQWEFIQPESNLSTRTVTLGTSFAFGIDISTVILQSTITAHDFMTAEYNANSSKWYIKGFIRGGQ